MDAEAWAVAWFVTLYLLIVLLAYSTGRRHNALQVQDHGKVEQKRT